MVLNFRPGSFGKKIIIYKDVDRRKQPFDISQSTLRSRLSIENIKFLKSLGLKLITKRKKLLIKNQKKIR